MATAAQAPDPQAKVSPAPRSSTRSWIVSEEDLSMNPTLTPSPKAVRSRKSRAAFATSMLLRFSEYTIKGRGFALLGLKRNGLGGKPGGADIHAKPIAVRPLSRHSSRSSLQNQLFFTRQLLVKNEFCNAARSVTALVRF